jgi:hypothetical protein
MPEFNALETDVLPADVKPGGEVPAAPERGESVRESLERALGEAQGSPDGKSKAEGDAGAGVTPGPASDAAPGGRTRGPDGKFAPKPPEVPEFSKAVVGPDGKPAPAATPAEDDPTTKPPASWKPEKAALWEKIAPEARAYVHEREQELQRGFERTAQVRQVAEGILTEFAPYQEILQQEGATPITAIRSLLQTAYALRSAEPEYRKALFLQLAQQYGVDFATPVDPALATTQGRLAQMDLQQREQAARAEMQNSSGVEQTLAAFAADHEFFPQVREHMGRLMHAGLAPDLETAYQQAVQLHPGVRGEMERRTVAARDAQVQEQRRQQAARATAGGAAPGAGGFGAAPEDRPGAARGESVRDTILKVWGEAERG